MRVQTKLTSLLLFISLALIGARYLYQTFENQRVVMLFREDNQEKEVLFNKLATLKGANLKTLSVDYTYWDEMVDFVHGRKSMAWAEQNMDETVLGTYQTDAIWVYRLDLSLAYSILDKDAAGLKDFPLPKEAIRDIFAKERLCHFFVYTGAGLIEIRGATIHPTADNARQTPPQGYLFAGRLWNKGYLDGLAELIGGEIVIDRTAQAVPDFNTLLKTNTIFFSKELDDWKGGPAAYLRVRIHSAQLEGFKKSSRNAMVTFIFFLAVIIAVITVFMTTALSRPFGVISQALKKENPDHLRPLEKDTSEFGDISRLISRFFEQKEDLVKEITERNKAEMRFRQVADAAEEWIWEVDRDGLYTYSSAVVDKILGYRPDEIVGKKYFYDFFFLEDRERLRKQSLEVFASRRLFRNFLNRNMHKDGHVVWLDTSGSPIMDEKGDFVGYRGVDTDVTERKRAEDELKEAYIRLKEIQEQLIQAEKLNAVGQLASGVAHEVRNPLAIILQGVDYLETKIPPSSGDIFEVLAMLRENIKRADKIINDLLDFSRAAHLNLGPADLGLILESSLDLVRTRFKFDNITVIREIKKDMPLVLADKNRLEQVFINVLLNAVQAMPQGGRITVRSYDKKLEEIRNGIGKRAQDSFYFGEMAAIVEIEDTGYGIPEENLKRIFDPFFTTKGQSGSGLGLSVSRNIIHMHRGLIYAESTPGKGTKITVMLKLAERA
ncbi:MAG: ATP-binding protein [Candidatus Omnitrophica bacterium]|nr:ATP-binding protein [Candidatus Omnitrophota bacterium]